MKKFISFKEFLNESNNRERIIEEFEKVFPKDIVEADPNERPFEITEENMQKIFDVLNKMMFDGKLKKIPIKCLDLMEMAAFLHQMTGERPVIYKFENFLSLYFALFDKDHKLQTLVILPDFESILIHRIRESCTIGYAIMCMFHEMIHCFDANFGNMLKLEYQKVTNGIDYDDHETEDFKRFMKTGKKQQIPIKKHGSAKEYEKLNVEAQEFFIGLSSELSEMTEKKREKSPTHIIFKTKDGHYASIHF